MAGDEALELAGEGGGRGGCRGLSRKKAGRAWGSLQPPRGRFGFLPSGRAASDQVRKVTSIGAAERTG